MIDLERAFGMHNLRRTKVALVYKKTGDLRACQLLLGHQNLTVPPSGRSESEQEMVSRLRRQPENWAQGGAPSAGSLSARHQVSDADMRVGQVKAVRVDVGETSVHVHSALRFIGVHRDSLEGGPRTVLRRKVLSARMRGDGENPAHTPENMNLHDGSPMGGCRSLRRT